MTNDIEAAARALLTNGEGREFKYLVLRDTACVGPSEGGSYSMAGLVSTLHSALAHAARGDTPPPATGEAGTRGDVVLTDGRKTLRVLDEGTFFIIEHDGKRQVGWKHGEAESVLRLLARAMPEAREGKS